MLREFFVNICIIVTFTFLSSQIHKRHPDTLSSPFKFKALSGILNGFYGIVLMLYSVHVTSTVFLDLRHLFIISAARFGVYSAVIAALIISAGRVVLGGATLPALYNLIACMIMAIGCGWISRYVKRIGLKWIFMNALGLVSITIVSYFLIEDRRLLIQLHLLFWTSSIIAGFILAFLTNYLRRANEVFNRLLVESKTDFLTGLNNVRKFESDYQSYISDVIEKNEGLSLLLIDIDFFKKVNDTYGHSAGDEVLIQLSDVLMKTSRKFDKLSRNGGEEFTILLPDTTLIKANEVAERVRKAVENQDFLLSDGTRLKITVSIGVASYPETITSPEKLLKQADQALYKAKQMGRNRVCAINT